MVHKQKVITEAMWEARLPSAPSDCTEEDNGPLLWNAINRYARVREQKSRRNVGLTVVITHANGLHKEVNALLSREASHPRAT